MEYTNRTDYTAHAAIHYDQDASGIWVIDQWKGRGKVAMSYYKFVPSANVPIHDGKKYYVIDGHPI